MTKRSVVCCVTLLLAFALLLAATQPAYAQFARVWTGNLSGIRADIRTPSSAMSGIPSGTTVKMATFVAYDRTSAGWLVRPGEYNNPISYYEWYDLSYTKHEVPLSAQSYNTSRAYDLRYIGASAWEIYIVGTRRRVSTEPTSGAQSLSVGGKTSAYGANLKGSVSNGNVSLTVPPSWDWLSTGYSTATNDYPLMLSITTANGAFSLSNWNY